MLAYRLRVATHLVPQSEPGQEALAAERQRGRARVEARLVHRGAGALKQRESLDERHAPEASARGQRAGQAGADHAAADDHDVVTVRAHARPAIRCSMSCTDLGACARQHLARGLRDDHVVLDADADAAPLLRHRAVVGRDVDARLHGQHHAGLQHAPLAADLVVADVVHVEPQPVPGTVHVEGAVGGELDQLAGLAVQQPQVAQALGDHAHRHVVRLVPVLARLHFADRGELRLEHHLVQRLLRRAEAPLHREGAGDVCGVVLVLAAGVDQHQVAGAQRRAVLDVMHDAAVGAAADDAAVGRRARAVVQELVQQLGLELVLEHAGLAGTHRAHVRRRRDRAGALHHAQFLGALVQAQLVQDVVEVEELAGRMRTGARLGADLVDPAHQLVVELRLLAHRVVEPLAALDQPGQDVVEVADREGVVGAVELAGPLGAGAQAVPVLALAVTLAAEQQELAVTTPGREHEHRLRFVETAEVVEVAVLAEREARVAVADELSRRGHDRDAALAHQRHQLAAPARVVARPDARMRQYRRRCHARALQCSTASAPGRRSAYRLSAAMRTNSSICV